MVSSTAYFTAVRSVIPATRSSSMSSSMVKRFFFISATRTFPSATTTLGRPQRTARKRMLFTVSTDRMAERHRRVRMGVIPMSRGMPKSCMGTAARSAMRRERTSSEGSSSPI